MKADWLYKIAVHQLQGIGPVTARKLIAYLGSEQEIFRQPEAKLTKVPGIGEHLARQIVQQRQMLKQAEKELAFVEKYKIEVLFFNDADYPSRLKMCEDAPLLLYKKGNAEVEQQRVVSIIGTRDATAYGRQVCEKLLADLADAGFRPLVVSGLAYGIDVCAHKAALRLGLPTVAVLAHGLSTLYPAVHREVAEELLTNGALLTEFGSDVKAYRNNFISRNRIVAGIAEATIVIESAEKGGALITAEMAMDYHRDVFAVPGRVGDKYSAGCNQLILNNKAALLRDANDLIQALNWDIGTTHFVQKKMFVNLSPEEEQLLEAIGPEATGIDEIAKKTGISMSKVSSLLLKLEFDNLVKNLPGKLFVRL